MIDTLGLIYALGFIASTLGFYRFLVPRRNVGVPKARVWIYAYLLAVMWFIFVPVFAYATYKEGEHE